MSRLPLGSDHMWKPEASLVALLAEARLSYSGRMTSAPSHTALCVILLVLAMYQRGWESGIYELVCVLKHMRELELVGVREYGVAVSWCLVKPAF